MPMLIQEKKKNPRNMAMYLDLLHIAVGVLVVICTVLAFLNPERNQFLFPVIFCLAAVLNGVNGWYRLRECGRDKRKKFGGLMLCFSGCVLLAICVISAISIWR